MEQAHKATDKDVKEDGSIAQRIKDVEKAVKTIRQELIAKLPPMRLVGKVISENLNMEAAPVAKVAVAADALVAA